MSDEKPVDVETDNKPPSHEFAETGRIVMIDPEQSLPAPAPVPAAMHPMVAMAMSSGQQIDPAQLDQLLQVQLKWEENEARKSYAAAIAHFRAIVPAIKKDQAVLFKNNDGSTTSYDHESLDGIMLTISAALGGCELAPTFNVVQENAMVTVTCRVTHSAGHFEETSMSSAPDSSGKKNPIQQIGSTVTYLQRYTLKALLGLSAGEDNDGIIPDVEDAPISELQAEGLRGYMVKHELSQDAFLNYLKTKGIESIEEIPASKIDFVMDKLEQAAAASAGS
ncbi:ERF family protein [uncultured Paraglaciecola sp.]|mgnify:CR=1 FL=1|uniref:ERF family protein n=1 Tax=uncultured Paraglaciecola sp. TaxID=1765024 RepID=UPI00261885C1|nr:ERF family protein [uncultured Paraglaciecola sp.]